MMKAHTRHRQHQRHSDVIQQRTADRDSEGKPEERSPPESTRSSPRNAACRWDRGKSLLNRSDARARDAATPAVNRMRMLTMNRRVCCRRHGDPGRRRRRRYSWSCQIPQPRPQRQLKLIAQRQIASARTRIVGVLAERSRSPRSSDNVDERTVFVTLKASQRNCRTCDCRWQREPT